MSEASIITLAAAVLVALPPTLLATASLVQAIKTKRKLDENTALTDVLVQKTEATEKKIDVVSKKTDDQTLTLDAVNVKAEVIAGHVNSEKTAGQGREAMYAAENKLLREMMVVLERSMAGVMHSASRPAVQVLEQIDKHTEQVEKNTAGIDKKIEALRNEA